MATVVSREIRLKSRPVGLLRQEHFELAEVTLPPLNAGELLVRNAYMSCDSTMTDRH